MGHVKHNFQYFILLLILLLFLLLDHRD
jgi:hypothetical protein